MRSIKPDTQEVEEEEQTKCNIESFLGVDTKLFYSEKCIHIKPVKDAGNSALSACRNAKFPIPTAAIEKLKPSNSQLKVFHRFKSSTNAEPIFNDTLPKTLDTKLLSDTRHQIQSSVSETIVIYLNKTENSTENGFNSLLLEASERELPFVARQNSLDSSITSVKEKIVSSSGSLDNVQLFLHALLSFAEKAYPQVVQQLDRSNSQEISFTFTCNLKSDGVKPPVPELVTKKSIKTRTSIVQPDVLPKKLNTDFLKFKPNPYNNQICFKLSLDKFLLNVLSLLPIVNNMFTNSAIKVPTLHFAKWHFRNIAQGYLLRFVLNKSNVNTLNIMRNLYFIIITTNTVNLFLEVKFNLKNDIFILEDIKPVNDSCEETTIEDSVSTMSTSSFGTGTFINDFSVFGPDIYKIEQNTFTDSDGEDTLSAFNSVMSTAVSRCTIVTEKRCVATSTIFCLHLPLPSKHTIDKGAGDELAFSVHDKPKLKSWLYKPWLTKKYTVPTTHNMEIPLNYFDETIFERMSNLHNKCTSPEFRKVFLKCFGHTLGCTLISLFISLL